MDLGTRPFIISQAPENNSYEYLGSDGISISESYELYLEKCAEFKAKARKYARDNEYLKNSIVHHEKIGYDGSNEAEILLEREQQKSIYEKAFEFKLFDDDPNAKYECLTGKGKRIRIIRELGEEERNTEFSEDFEEKRSCWFSRLRKNLEILKNLTPEKIREIESIMARERGELVEGIVEDQKDIAGVKERENYPCSCSALK